MSKRLRLSHRSRYMDACKLGDDLRDAYFAKQFVFNAEPCRADINAEIREHLSKQLTVEYCCNIFCYPDSLPGSTEYSNPGIFFATLLRPG